MSFFKKLFNRIVGKKEEAPPAEVVVEQQALPAPEPVVEEVVVEEPVVEAPAPKPEKAKKVETEKPEPKKAEKKKPEPKKPEPKKVVAKGKTEVAKKVEKEKPGPAKKGKVEVVPVKSKAKGKAKGKVEEKKKSPVVAKPLPPAKGKTKKKIIVEEPTPVEEIVETELEAKEPLPPSPRLRRTGPPVAETIVEGTDSAETPGAETQPRDEVLAAPADDDKIDAVEEPVAVVEEPPPPPPKLEAKTPPPPPPEPERKGWFSRLKDGLSKSSKSITGSITAIFTKRKLDAATLQELEDTLIQADLGLPVAERIIKAVSTGRYDKEIDPEEVKLILAAEVAKVLKPVEVPFNFGDEKPFVILVVGVNGSGKTTTIGKLGSIAAREGFKVKFAACDTFRAAAIEQLTVWGKRIGAETISRPPGSDAAGLAFDAMKSAKEDGTDIVFIDTAGRLHNKVYLMDELDKVVRVIKKYDAAAPHAVLLVLDATTGQNALAQAEAFTKVAGVTGLIMTKLDGTARGGILVAIAEKFALPIHAIGVGETIDDLQVFDAEAFARAIAGLEET